MDYEQWVKMGKPKDAFMIRQYQWITLAIIFLIAVYVLNGQQWFTYIINKIAEACIGLVILYYGTRTILHTRTHELDTTARYMRENYLVIAIALVIGGAFVGG